MTTQPKTLSRAELIDAVRKELVRLTDDEHSMCLVAAERGIFCKGFAHESDQSLRQHYSWIADRYPKATREQLEEMANAWQLARQEVDHLPTACDVQTMEHDACFGWEDFSDDDLRRFLVQLKGEKK